MKIENIQKLLNYTKQLLEAKRSDICREIADL
jgi:hypothetical protein